MRPEPTYFRVGYFGRGFPTFLRVSNIFNPILSQYLSYTPGIQQISNLFFLFQGEGKLNQVTLRGLIFARTHFHELERIVFRDDLFSRINIFDNA